MHRLALACLVTSLLLPARAANANLLVNPSFELGTPTGAFTTLPLGSTAITGWVVTNTDVDIVGTFWVSQHGSRSVDLDGLQPGCLAQTFVTEPGKVYLLTFYLAGNPACGPVIKQMRVTAAGQFADFSFNVTGKSRPNMGWVLKDWSFVADASSTTLEFCSTGATVGCGPAIDNLTVDIPLPTESSTWGRVKTIYR